METDEGQRDSRGAGTQTEDPPDVIIIGWDGVQRDHFWECYDGSVDCPSGLPNIESLSGGVIRDLTITDGATETKPGWVQILSGYNAALSGVYDNLNYQPLSEGYSLFEKVEDYLGDEAVDTIFVGGKGTNVGGTCWGETTIVSTTERLGEPWCLAKRGVVT